jgi:hypothetical protein
MQLSVAESLSVSRIAIGVGFWITATEIKGTSQYRFSIPIAISIPNWLGNGCLKNIPAFLKNIFAQKLERPLDELLGPEKATAPVEAVFLSVPHFMGNLI